LHCLHITNILKSMIYKESSSHLKKKKQFDRSKPLFCHLVLCAPISLLMRSCKGFPHVSTMSNPSCAPTLTENHTNAFTTEAKAEVNILYLGTIDPYINRNESQ
jgi:hypothetical protein